ncbi:MAG: DUF4369 domain-containing protein [Algicola sp.]|nr:DUF4369 domain-containing protein [Algicola sp.]
MKYCIALVLGLMLISCGKEEQHDFTLKGHVKGLKKGTVYLQKQQDSLMITLDSLAINGTPDFELHAQLEEPEILFLKLHKNDNQDGTIVFFADKGITTIQSTLKNFNYDAKIQGSEQQATLDEYLVMMSKFNDKNLDMIKESLESQKENDTVRTATLEKDFDNLIKRKYLYTINFAVNHPDSEVSPYLAISEVANTSLKFLEEIYNALDEDIQVSKYGVQLKELIEKRKLN